MTQQELQLEIAKLLEQMGIIIDDDLKGVESNLKDDETISYIFFIRAAEIFKAISILLSTDVDQVVPGKILLRSLSEYYILLKSSIEDKSFNSRHIKSAGREKEKWFETALKHHAASGFKQDPQYFEEMKEKTRQLHEKYESNLQKTFQLFQDRNELPMYLNIYATASIYVHGDRQSFNMYYNPGGSVKPTSDRDYSPLLRHTGLAAGQVMLQSYELFCKVLKHETTAIKHIEGLLEACAGTILKSMPSDYE